MIGLGGDRSSIPPPFSAGRRWAGWNTRLSQDMSLFTEYRYQNAHDANIDALRGVGNTSNSLSIGMKFSL